MPDNPHDPTPTELRKQATRARAFAEQLVGDVAEKRLRELADELDAKADAMEQPQPVPPPRQGG
jgi:hypothetical protein